MNLKSSAFSTLSLNHFLSVGFEICIYSKPKDPQYFSLKNFKISEMLEYCLLMTPSKKILLLYSSFLNPYDSGWSSSK